MSRYGNHGTMDLEWIERWARTVNDDRLLPVWGRFFTGRYILGIDDVEYLIVVDSGRIVRIAEGLTPNDMGADFALKAPASAWNKFRQKVPPPMFNDIWAMAHPLHKQLTVEGNHKPFWQNLRALTRMLALMREV